MPESRLAHPLTFSAWNSQWPKSNGGQAVRSGHCEFRSTFYVSFYTVNAIH